MLFDTDVLIWVQRGNRKAAASIDGASSRFLSVQSMMELLQCARDRKEQRLSRSFVADMGFVLLPLTEAVGHRALVYVEEYGLSAGMRAGDALVAATAIESGLTLCTANAKHFRAVKELDLAVLRP